MGKRHIFSIYNTFSAPAAPAPSRTSTSTSASSPQLRGEVIKSDVEIIDLEPAKSDQQEQPDQQAKSKQISPNITQKTRDTYIFRCKYKIQN